MMTPWAPGPNPQLPLRITILGALAYTALAYRDHGHCADCGDRPCPDHADDAAIADTLENAYMQVAVGTGAWADFDNALTAGMN